MKVTSLIGIAAAGLLAFGARAQEATPDNWLQVHQATTSGATRAEVQADLARARAAGQWDEGAQYGVYRAAPVAPGKTRAEVKAELAEARANGELAEGYEYGVFDKPFVSTRTRAEVRAEAIEATRRGRLSSGDNS